MPRPWNAYGLVRGLNAPPRRIGRPGRLDRVGRLEQLVAALDRARPGHHRQRPVADHRVEDPDDRVLRVELARGQLERPADRRDRGDAGERGRSARGAPACATPISPTTAMTRPLGADVIERRQALGQDLALDAEDLGLAGADGHHHEHRVAVSSVGRPAQNKKAEVWPLLRLPGTTRAPRSQRPGAVMPGIESRRSGSCACTDGIEPRPAMSTRADRTSGYPPSRWTVGTTFDSVVAFVRRAWRGGRAPGRLGTRAAGVHPELVSSSGSVPAPTRLPSFWMSAVGRVATRDGSRISAIQHISSSLCRFTWSKRGRARRLERRVRGLPRSCRRPARAERQSGRGLAAWIPLPPARSGRPWRKPGRRVAE